MSIIYLTHQEIDKLKWDSCIRNAFNGLIYGYSWYLDIVAEQWDGLVYGDYEHVMPIPYRTKFGINLIYTPAVCPMLGVFSRSVLSAEIIDRFIKAIPRRFSVSHIRLNKFNQSKLTCIEKPLFCMDLISIYDNVSSKFSKLTTESLDDATHNNLHIKTHLNIDDFVEFYGKNGGSVDYLSSMRLASLIKTLINLKVAEIVAVYTPDNELLAAGLFVAYLNNATVLACGVSAKGIKQHALYPMFDAFFKANCNKNITLDCPDVNERVPASFYTGLGCKAFSSKEYRHSSILWPFKYFIT